MTRIEYTILLERNKRGFWRYVLWYNEIKVKHGAYAFLNEGGAIQGACESFIDHWDLTHGNNRV